MLVTLLCNPLKPLWTIEMINCLYGTEHVSIVQFFSMD